MQSFFKNEMLNFVDIILGAVFLAFCVYILCGLIVKLVRTRLSRETSELNNWSNPNQTDPNQS